MIASLVLEQGWPSVYRIERGYDFVYITSRQVRPVDGPAEVWVLPESALAFFKNSDALVHQESAVHR